MKTVDRILQNWRIDKAKPYIDDGSSVLDIGCADATLFKRIGTIGRYVGVDPHLEVSVEDDRARLVRGIFPEVPEADEKFDCITLLACLEHVPLDQQKEVAERCFSLLKDGGRLIVTVPDAKVDHILAVLKALRLIDGMELDEHYHFDVSATPSLFEAAGLTLKKYERFQLGLNNLFVFERAAGNA